MNNTQNIMYNTHVNETFASMKLKDGVVKEFTKLNSNEFGHLKFWSKVSSKVLYVLIDDNNIVLWKSGDHLAITNYINNHDDNDRMACEVFSGISPNVLWYDDKFKTSDINFTSLIESYPTFDSYIMTSEQRIHTRAYDRDGELIYDTFTSPANLDPVMFYDQDYISIYVEIV